mgnify:CR=1 FL=1
MVEKLVVLSLERAYDELNVRGKREYIEHNASSTRLSHAHTLSLQSTLCRSAYYPYGLAYRFEPLLGGSEK